MPGLKTTQLADTPVAFWTFDLDVDASVNGIIFDEIDNANPLSVAGTSYSLQQPSLNNMEVTDQASVSIKNTGASSNTNDITYFFAPHTSTFNFQDTGNGSFSVELLVYKKPAIRDFSSTSNHRRPIIFKSGLIELAFYDNWTATDYLYAKVHTDKEFYLYNGGATGSRVGTIWDRVLHVVVTYRIDQQDIQDYTATTTFYVNGHIVEQKITNYTGSIPNSTVGTDWLIGASGGISSTSDFSSELLKLDQIAIYDYCLTPEQVGNHYRKTKTYSQVITDSQPNQYYQMSELTGSTLATGINGIGGALNGTYYGSYTLYEPGQPRDVGGKSTYFFSGGNASVTSYDIYGNPSQIINTGANYSVEFWFKVNPSWGDRGAFVSCFEENYGWDGLVIWMNTADNELAGGRIQVSEDVDTHINSDAIDIVSNQALNFADGNWHYLVVTRTSTTLSLYVDGILRGQKSDLVGYNSNGDPSQLHLMGMPPGNFHVTGWMTDFAYYSYNLTEFEIQNRWLYTLRYRLEGYTLLQGNPVETTVRLYDHISGNLIDEIQSSSATGYYAYYPQTNRLVDVLAFIEDNNTTRYRAHGPIKPAEYTDDYGS